MFTCAVMDAARILEYFCPSWIIKRYTSGDIVLFQCGLLSGPAAREIRAQFDSSIELNFYSHINFSIRFKWFWHFKNLRANTEKYYQYTPNYNRHRKHSQNHHNEEPSIDQHLRQHVSLIHCSPFGNLQSSPRILPQSYSLNAEADFKRQRSQKPRQTKALFRFAVRSPLSLSPVVVGHSSELKSAHLCERGCLRCDYATNG